MIFKIHFTIGRQVQLNHVDVLPVTLKIYDRAGQIEELSSLLIPLPKSLEDKFIRWQQYVGTYKNRKVVKNSGNLISGVINITELTSSLKIELNKWLNCDGWIDGYGLPDLRVNLVLKNFRQGITERDEVQIIVQTEDLRLRQLPWQEWDTLAEYTNRGVEVAISATNFKRLSQKQTPQINATVRILAIFGDETLGLEEEGKFLENLKLHGGELHVLQQPTRLELEQSLKDPQGWHIFFFAGHSESTADGRVGRFQINTVDGDRGFVEIAELRELLRGAIENKLQLAIFNSCDGLGLANQLTELSLPYCVVMREVVESEVARELLKNFLAAFVRNHSLFASVGIARRQLQLQFAVSKSWLPVIVANPLAPELTWNGLFSERRLSWQWEVVLGFSTLAVLLCLPIGIFYEFQGWEALKFYAQLYPHLVVYPSLFCWISLFAFYRAHCMIRVKTRVLITCSLVTALITLGTLFFELNGDRVMLIEYKPNSVLSIDARDLPQLYSTWKTSNTDLITIPQNIFDIEKSFDINGNLRLNKSDLETGIKEMYRSNEQSSFQGLLRIATSSKVWKKNLAFSSITYQLYLILFTVSVACILQPVILNLVIIFTPHSISGKSKYLIYLVLGEFGILLWLPFEIYSINYSKATLFSHEFRGFVSGFNIAIFIIFFVILVMTINSITKNAANQHKIVLSAFLLSTFVLLPLFSLFGATTIDQVFGMSNSDPLTPWFASIFLCVPIFWVIVYWIDSSVGEK
jgi:CHAT domain